MLLANKHIMVDLIDIRVISRFTFGMIRNRTKQARRLSDCQFLSALKAEVAWTLEWIASGLNIAENLKLKLIAYLLQALKMISFCTVIHPALIN